MASRYDETEVRSEQVGWCVDDPFDGFGPMWGKRSSRFSGVYSRRTPTPLFLLLRHLRESGMNSIKTGDIDGFKVPSTIPQDLLLIHDLVGGVLPQASSRTHAAETGVSLVARTSNSGEGDTDSIGSSSSEDSSDEEGDVNMSKADVIMKEEEVGKGADSEEEVEAGLLGGGGSGDPMTM